MTVDVRRLTDYDAVRAGIDLWNEVRPAFAVPERLVAQNVFAPFAGLDATAWSGFADGDLVAAALGKRLTERIADYAGPEQGWVSLFAVDPSVENRDAVADELLAAVERGMVERGVIRLRFGGDPGQFLPGLPTEFDRLRARLRDAGFESRGTVHDLRRDIGSFEPPDGISEVGESWPGLSLERVDETPRLYSFLADQFPGRWRYEAENVCRVPGGESDYWLLRREGRTVGFSRTNAQTSAYRGANVNWAERLDGRVCGLGPLGVHESYRGRGWGLWMISTLVERYRDAGYDRMVVDWTGLLDYYAKLGFEPWLAYETLEKEASA
ncbi:GNAT family N-acetyltransferase [Haladaptatus salinisoli]|uniref:GNAT family N-acetyltransferase n=1 Tax=Haladaptatus salinisoli TaxID=2884876 RepID=UPI001D0A5E71|nr:GNAT family N-acetyltransferase [Haladaptatus salinisoli]